MKYVHSGRQDYAATLDASGLHCPYPIIRCKAMLALLDEGEILYMIATDRDAPREIRQLIRHSGNRLCEHQIIKGKHHFRIEKHDRRPRRRLTPRSLSVQSDISKLLHFGVYLLHRLISPSTTQLRAL